MISSNGYFLLTFLLTLGGMLILASGRKTAAKNSADFSLGGRKGGSWHVFGAITGTLVGGASTVGTVQLAFIYGLSAWWFTLGSGLACLFLGLFMAIPLRHSQVTTIPEYIAIYHGNQARILASLFAALGMFIQIVAQLLACGAILAVLFHLPLVWSASLSALLVILFTVTGGMKAAGRIGLLKMVLIYLTMVISALICYLKFGGWSGLFQSFPAFPWFNLFGYGASKGISDLLSMLVGVISTQTYLQAVFSASDGYTARRGAVYSAVLIPPLGLLGVLVGLYMRSTQPDLESALALPTFLSLHLHPAIAGIAFATLLIAAVGTASGLALGVSTTLRIDLLRHWRAGIRQLFYFRALTTLVVVAAYVLLLLNLGSAIMDWSFLSMGLRGATFCVPLLFAVFWPAAGLRRAGFWSILLAPLIVVFAGLVGFDRIPPLYLGLGLSLLIFLFSALLRRMTKDR